MTLIELDRDTPLDPGAGTAPPPHRYRVLGLLLGTVLTVLLGGAAPHTGTVWEYLGLVPSSAGVDAPIQLAGGRLFTIAPAGDRRVLTAWEPRPEPARVWSTDLPPDGTTSPGGVFSPLRVRQHGDVVLVTTGPATTALDSRTGRIRWTTPSRVTVGEGGIVGDGGTGLVTERIFRDGTLYDQDSGDPGMLYFSADGQPHTEPPIRTEVRGIDLDTGRVRWTAAPSGSATVDLVPGEQPAVLITASDRLTLHDARTGGLLRETALPRHGGAGPSTSDVIGDVALVGYDEAELRAGYDTRTLEPLWTRPARAEMDPPSCTGLLCAGSRDATAVLDSRTGRTAWALTSAADLDLAGGRVLRTDPATGGPVGLLDPATGESLADLSGWADTVESFADRTLLLRRDNEGGGQAFGVIRPGRPEVRILGVADLDGEECGGDDRYLVCRDLRGLRIWAYRV